MNPSCFIKSVLIALYILSSGALYAFGPLNTSFTVDQKLPRYNHFYKAKTISEKQLNSLFLKIFKNNTQHYLDSNIQLYGKAIDASCHARTHLINYKLHELFSNNNSNVVLASKILIHNPLNSNSPFILFPTQESSLCYYRWTNHLANIVLVKKNNGQLMYMIIDPMISDRPLHLTMWLSALLGYKNSNTSDYISQSLLSNGFYNLKDKYDQLFLEVLHPTIFFQSDHANFPNTTVSFLNEMRPNVFKAIEGLNKTYFNSYPHKIKCDDTRYLNFLSNYYN